MLSTASVSATSIVRARPSPPRPVALPQRRHDAEGGVEPGERVADADPDPHRRQVRCPGRMVGQVTQAPDRLADNAERGAVAVGPVLAEAGDVRDHEIGPAPAQRLLAQAQLGELPRPEVLHQRVAARGQAQHDPGAPSGASG